MGVKVETPFATWTYDHATNWFVGVDGELQIYQPTVDDEECTISEFARGMWQTVYLHPLPDPRPEEYPEEEDKEEEDK